MKKIVVSVPLSGLSFLIDKKIKGYDLLISVSVPLSGLSFLIKKSMRLYGLPYQVSVPLSGLSFLILQEGCLIIDMEYIVSVPLSGLSFLIVKTLIYSSSLGSFRPLIGVIISNLWDRYKKADQENGFRPLIGVIISNLNMYNEILAALRKFPSPYRGYHF